MLDRYMHYCVISIININNGIKNVTPTKYGYIGGYVKMRESLYPSYYLDHINNILNHIVTSTISPRYEGFCMVYTPEWYQKQRYHQISIPYCYQNM